MCMANANIQKHRVVKTKYKTNIGGQIFYRIGFHQFKLTSGQYLVEEEGKTFN